jgi:hypothetical protein
MGLKQDSVLKTKSNKNKKTTQWNNSKTNKATMKKKHHPQ